MIDTNKTIVTAEDAVVRMISFTSGTSPYIMVGFVGCSYAPQSWDKEGNHYLGHKSKKLRNTES
jgi:hypothetical protein